MTSSKMRIVPWAVQSERREFVFVCFERRAEGFGIVVGDRHGECGEFRRNAGAIWGAVRECAAARLDEE
jgi:hypothetical protein